MSSGFGGSDLNQLKDKDDIEDDDDRVHLVGTRHRSSDPSDAPVTSEELKYLPANQRPGGLLLAKNTTKILPPTARKGPHTLGPQPGNNLHSLRNMPSHKRGSVGLTAPNSSEDTRPRKQQKTSGIEAPSVDTDDEQPMELDGPYDRKDRAAQRQEVRKPKGATPHSVRSSGYFQGGSLSKSRQTNLGPGQQKSRKNGSKNIGRADYDFVNEVNAIQTEPRPTQSTHAGALQNNNSAKWTSSGDGGSARWTGGKRQIAVSQQQRQKSGSSTTKLDLLCFQCGTESCDVEEGIQSLFVEIVQGRRISVFYGEKQKEESIWDMGIDSIVTVNANQERRLFAIQSANRPSGGEADRVVVFTLKHDEDVDQFKAKIGEFARCTPKEVEVKFFDKLANSLRVWKSRGDAESHRLAPVEPMATRQRQRKPQKLAVEIDIRRSTRNKTGKAEAMEILPLKCSQGTLTDEFEDFPRETASSKIPKLELPKPRWETSLVYPPTGPKREVIDYDDLSRLNSDQFLNDNIVNFYLRYIEVQLQKRNPGLAKETYFLNTFFYERLTKRDEKGKRREIDSVLKWTAKVDIFKTSYIVVPINESSHWYLAVICNLCHLERKMKDKVPDSPESKPIDLESNGTSIETREDGQDITLRNASDAEAIVESSIPRDGEEQGVEVIGKRDSLERMVIDGEQPNENENFGSNGGRNVDELNRREIIELDDSPSQRLRLRGKGKPKAKEKSTQKKNYIAPDTPAIIILDSMGFGTSTHSSTIKNLRDYLAAEARSKRNLAITKYDIKATYAKAPNQNNWYDCGLYLLHYVERFLDRPKEFAAMFLAKEVNMRDQELWRKEEIKGMREKLFHLFVKLHEEQEALEMEQKGFKKRDGVNASEFKGQKGGNRKGPAKDVMAADAERSAKDKDIRKVWTDSGPAGASLGQLEHQLGALVNGGDCYREEENTPTKHTIGEFGMQSINLEGGVQVSNSSTLQPKEVTLSVRNNQ